jgi:glycosyltransferase involved in cell wall biosynthesis
MLTVLSIAYPFAPVGPDAVGGAEQIATLIDDALVNAGHRSVVIASEKSRVAGILIPVRETSSTITDSTRDRVYCDHHEMVQNALACFDIDIVHMHGIDFDRYFPDTQLPVHVTLHLPPEWYSTAGVHFLGSRTSFNFVSSSQRRRASFDSSSDSVIENGIPVDEMPVGVPKSSYAFAMGRICYEKGFHLALDAARRAGIELKLAGRVFPFETHQGYFETHIKPRLDFDRRLVGPLSGERKRRVLSAAKCLLVPSLVQETSSLVAMEALACGTPVIAFRAGALADIVEHGRTGFVVADEYEMAAAIDAAAGIEPDVCRSAARERFSAKRMTEKYLNLYHNLLANRGGETVSAQ